MFSRTLLATGLTLLLALGPVASAAASALPNPTADQTDSFRRYGFAYPTIEPLRGWEKALQAALEKQGIDAAADSLAKAYGLSKPDMRQLARLWLLTDGLMDARRNGEKSQVTEGDLKDAYLALAASSGHAPLVMQAAGSAYVLMRGGKCDGADFAALTRAAPGLSASWILAETAGCGGWLAAFTAKASDKATAALVALAQERSLRPAEQMALLAHLSGRSALIHVAEADRMAVQAALARIRLETLLDGGFGAEAIAVYEGLDGAPRDLVLKPAAEGSVSIDGLPVRLRSDARSRLGVDLAAAYLLAGRTDRARELLRTFPSELAAAQAVLACKISGAGGRCSPSSDYGVDHEGLLAVDMLANHAQDDPYPLAEAFFAGFDPSPVATGVQALITCRLFETVAPDRCGLQRQVTVDYLRGGADPWEDPLANAVADEADLMLSAARDAALDTERRASAAAVAGAIAGLGGEGRAESGRGGREAPPPAPPLYAEAPLPPQYRIAPLAPGADAPPPPSLKGMAPLPDGYAPVRVGQDGQRVAVVSLSQNYDPTGEVSAGGYWLHLSNDGGKTWSRPLYTGLAQFYPYAVVPNARMPLFDGDALTLAVSVREIDTASITYPPVGLQLKRKADNLYLRIPLAALTRDSDGDGLTDLAEQHLLLDPRKADDFARPVRTGGRAMPACRPEGRADAAIVARLLDRVFGRGTGAIIEPVERAPGEDPLAAIAASSHQAAPNSSDRPVFVAGDAAAFACLAATRLIVVYDNGDLQQLRAGSPDFHAVSIEPIVWNRDHTRGYVVWSAGWTGGTLRVIRQGEDWKMDEISSWIT